MKQKDLAMVILIAALAGGLSFLITRSFIVKPESKRQTAEVVESITAEFKLPDKKYYNDQAINPTKLIEIGSGNTQNPFN